MSYDTITSAILASDLSSLQSAISKLDPSVVIEAVAFRMSNERDEPDGGASVLTMFDFPSDEPKTVIPRSDKSSAIRELLLNNVQNVSAKNEGMRFCQFFQKHYYSMTIAVEQWSTEQPKTLINSTLFEFMMVRPEILSTSLPTSVERDTLRYWRCGDDRQ